MLIKNFLTFVIFSIVLSSSLRAQNLSLKEGDIIGQSEIIEDSSTSFIEAATRSRFGHIGLVLKYENELAIYEEYPPGAQIVSLNEFFNRPPGLFSVIRKDVPLTQEELTIIHNASDELVKINYPYNYSQTFNNESMNCSEFINFVFKKANVSVGKIETINDMNLKAFKGVPWRLWRLSDPHISKKDLVITPKSIMQTKGWTPIYGTLNPKDNLSDRDLYLQWKNENALSEVAHQWYLFKWELNILSRSFKF